ncbi:hypothetical protein [Dulcicalothrix desertica]|uniref:hypothetical protein n=1 Tax=Dulcicalothrix desertica TaxID=32056 RepID=UPI000378CCD2|nr:hypothetical protein [Dulcicalothrix desertica]TWH39315.1 hypothetical protein CAL7102_08538 [Dulcicalothrix desertica PCC 7102]
MTTNNYSPLFRLVARFIKYFLLMSLGIAIAYTLANVLGASHFGMSLVGIAFGWFWRLGVMLLCLIAVTMIYESLR